MVVVPGAELAVGVDAPRPQRPVRPNPDGPSSPGRELGPPPGRSEGRDSGDAGAELPLLVVAPGPQRSVGTEGNTVFGAADGRCPGRVGSDLHRTGPISLPRRSPSCPYLPQPQAHNVPLARRPRVWLRPGADTRPVARGADADRGRVVCVAAHDRAGRGCSSPTPTACRRCGPRRCVLIPVATPVQFVAVPTCSGLSTVVVLPSPSWPCCVVAPRPQRSVGAQRDAVPRSGGDARPVGRRADLLRAPDGLGSPYRRPVARRNRVPQAHSVPSARTPSVWSVPAARLTQSVAVPIRSGERCRGLVVPSPSCPEPLPPHAHNVPSVRIATVWPSPAATPAQSVAVPICSGVGWSVEVPSPSCP